MASTSFISDQEYYESNPYLPFLIGNHFDIETYADNYRPRSKIFRLLSIANRCSGGDDRKLEALEIAYKEAKKGKDVKLFTRIVKEIRGRLGPNFAMDENWCNEVKRDWDKIKIRVARRAVHCKDKFFREGLDSSEDVRTAYFDAANWHYIHGETRAARTWYLLSLTYGENYEDFLEVFVRVLVVLIERGSFDNAEVNAIDGLDHIEPTEMDFITLNSLHCTIGLGSLKEQRFTDAAHKFMQVSEELDNRFSVVMAAHDIAAYGGLCALATFKRTELKTFVMDNKDFQSYLGSSLEVKELVNDFYSRRYSSALEHLANLREWLMCDIYLFDQFETLSDQIRNQALVQYIQPYVAVDLQTMADAFNTSIEPLTKELVDLINTNQIKAKIDPIDKVLYTHKDQRIDTFRSVLQSCSVFERDLKSIILFKSLLYHV